MRKVEYHGKEYDVPNYTQFMTIDKDGTIIAWEVHPKCDYIDCQWITEKGKHEYIVYGNDDNIYSDWKKSCKRI